MDDSTVRQRADTARQHLDVARLVAPGIDRPEPSSEAQVAASNAISAGIAAVDAICGHVLRERSNGEDHRAATGMLATIQPDGAALAKKFARLMKDKTLLQYGGFCTRNRAVEMIAVATDVVDAMDDLLKR